MVFIGANATHAYIHEIHPRFFQQLRISTPKIDMWTDNGADLSLCIFMFHVHLSGNGLRVESRFCESFDDFIAHFKGLLRNARPDEGMKLCGVRLKSRLHTMYSLGDDTFHRSSPSRMNGCNSFVLRIKEKNRYTVSRRNADTKSRFSSDEGIDAIEEVTSLCNGKLHRFCRNFLDAVRMGLTGHDETFAFNAQFSREPQTIGSDTLGVILTIVGYVECSISPHPAFFLRRNGMGRDASG